MSVNNKFAITKDKKEDLCKADKLGRFEFLNVLTCNGIAAGGKLTYCAVLTPVG